MTRAKIAYIGGGSTRAAGTMASFVAHGAGFVGSEVVLIDLDPERLELVRVLASKMARARGLDVTISATTDRRAGLEDCDAVLSSFRPGGFEARIEDERIPLRNGVIGQETQGAGGFFMALRALHALRGICDDIADVAPRARIFNYTNPVNVVAQAVSSFTSIPIVSLCEGPIVFPQRLARIVGLDPERLHTTSVGLNHGSWSVDHLYDGESAIPLIRAAWERRRDDPDLSAGDRRLLRLAALMESIPSDYFKYYYFEDEVLAELTTRSTTRAQDILASTQSYWDHYAEQAGVDDPVLDPERSRGGVFELELAILAMDAVLNDTGAVYPVNVPNRGNALPGFSEDLVVELTGRCDASFVTPLPQRPLPSHLTGLVHALAEYQLLAAEAGWQGDTRQAVRALTSNPLVRTVDRAERLYGELAAAHRHWLPARLVA